jgi:hypothetical protein
LPGAKTTSPIHATTFGFVGGDCLKSCDREELNTMTLWFGVDGSIAA